MLKNKTVLLGVTGSIAAYKTAGLASMLIKQHADVHVIMTKNATNFIHPTTFETLTRNKCIIDTFDRDFSFDVKHISLAQKADIVMIAPASANVIGKMANGIADDMLTTTVMACKAPIYLSPAMNTNMYENPIVQDNIEKLKRFGMHIIEPASGMLACRDVGKGKMPEPEELFDCICQEIVYEKDLSGKKVLITAGPTQEAIDPVRYITNHSSGKMGCALARAASRRGADVTLVTGPVSITPPRYVKIEQVQSAADLYESVTKCAAEQDVIIMAAAVADYTPAQVSTEKMKKKDSELSIELDRTRDVLAHLGETKRAGQFLCGFSMETENMIENSRAKLVRKKLDMIVANNLKTPGAGFHVDTNVVTILTKEKEIELPLLTKEETAHAILDQIIGII